MKTSHLEDYFLLLLRGSGLPDAAREYRFSPPRRFRWDFSYPDKLLAFEIQGGIYMPKGGHTSVSGYINECDKHNLAISLGWSFYRFTEKHLKDRAVETIGIIRKAYWGEKR